MLPAVVYRNYLDDKGKEAYRLLTDGLLHYNSQIIMPYSRLELNSLRKVINAVHLDHPELFYVNWWQYESVSSLLFPDLMLHFNFLLSCSSIDVCWRVIEESISNMRKLTTNISSIEKKYEVIVHHIISTVHYNDTGSAFWDHTAAGPILSSDHTCVCEGIAKLFLLYCQHLHVPCTMVVGTLNDHPHAWNVIEYRGTLRYIDLTSLMGIPILMGIPSYIKREDQLLHSSYQWDISPFRILEATKAKD